MTGALTIINTSLPVVTGSAVQQQFVTLRLGGQMFGISVLAVRDVMRHQPIAAIPLAQEVIAGSLNVRGRIVTAYDMRRRMGMPPMADGKQGMLVVVDFQQEHFALMVDEVGDVLSLSMSEFEKVPANIDPSWRALAAGVFKLKEELLIILDVAHVITLTAKDAA